MKHVSQYKKQETPASTRGVYFTPLLLGISFIAGLTGIVIADGQPGVLFWLSLALLSISPLVLIYKLFRNLN